jgi:DNA processing protein
MPQHTQSLPFWLALLRFRKFGSKRMRLLDEAFSDMQDAFEAKREALEQAGIEPKLAKQFIEKRPHLNPEKELKLLHEHDVRAVTWHDETYPERLRHIYDPPPVLFVRGTLPNSHRPHLAVVGSRKATRYGKTQAQELLKPLARAGVVIVSGLAYGIDGQAHKTTVEAEGVTVAVLGGGVDENNLYPARHRPLARDIANGTGAVISEFPIGTASLPSHFPIRNRIISGMCRATLVIEATEKSGSLITANTALKQNRDVLAVPGPVHSELSKGTNELIKTGAGVVTEPSDLFQALNLTQPKKQQACFKPESKSEEMVYAAISKEPRHIDTIIDACNLPPAKTTSILSMLEMKEAIRKLDGQRFIRT